MAETFKTIYREVEDFLRSDFRYKDSFDRMLECYPSQRALVIDLFQFVFFDSRRKEWPELTRHLASGTGKTLPTLRNFSGRIRLFADEIEQVNRGVTFYEARFRELAGGLRDYADFLEQYLSSEKDMIAINDELARSEANDLLCRITRAAKDKTGNDMYADIALLLSGTAEKVGTQTDDQEYSPYAIKMRIWRMTNHPEPHP